MYVAKTVLTKQNTSYFRTQVIDCAVWLSELCRRWYSWDIFGYNGYLLLTSSDPIKLVLPWLLPQQWLRSANPVLRCDQRRCNVQLGRVISVSRDGRLRQLNDGQLSSWVRCKRQRSAHDQETGFKTIRDFRVGSCGGEGRKSEKVWMLEPPVCLDCFKRPMETICYSQECFV